MIDDEYAAWHRAFVDRVHTVAATHHISEQAAYLFCSADLTDDQIADGAMVVHAGFPAAVVLELVRTPITLEQYREIGAEFSRPVMHAVTTPKDGEQRVRPRRTPRQKG